MKATRDFFGEHLISLAELDSSIVVVNCDLGEATRTLDFKRKFPNKKIDIFSSDTMNKKDSKEKIRKIMNNEIQILVGTQLISKD